MASRDDGGDSGVSRHNDSDSSDSSYASSEAEEAHHDEAVRYRDQFGDVCQYRSARFHDQECERFFDCPTHSVERALSEGQGQGQDAVHHEHGAAAGDAQTAAGDVSPMSEDAGGQEASEGEVSTLPPPGADEPVEEVADIQMDGERAPTPPPRDEAPPGTSQNPITLPDSLPLRAQVEEGADSRNEIQVGSNLGQASRPVPDAHNRTFEGLNAESSAGGPAQHPGLAEFTLPRWQPDAEVTYCPICRTQFSIFVRKHHCRKCGRVVCNSCSPHRITIPYPYIVQPPWVQSAPRSPLPPLGSDGAVSEQFGGERVRLCNPCVPDPNITPPQAQGIHSRSQSSLPQAVQGNAGQPTSRWSSYFGGAPTNDPHVRSRSVTMVHGMASSSRAASHPYNQGSTENRILSGTPPVYYQTQANPHQSAYEYMNQRRMATAPRASSSTFHRRLSSQLPPLPGQGPLPPLPPLPPLASSHRQTVAAAPPPPPQIAEEDECPVCHRELPPRTLQNYEALREAHITSCIASHSAYGGRAGPSSGGSGSGGASQNWAVTRRRTGMFPYTATEKDCVDSAECSICLEEFEVGVPMARLECLCRFHRMCIDAWWERHPGRCPMHQHEDFGY